MKTFNQGEIMKKRSNSGFTLIEVLVAMAIFAFGAMSIATLQGTVAKGNADARRLSDATKIARELVEEMGLLRSLYWTINDVRCQFVPFYLPNGSIQITPEADLRAYAAGFEDPLCPTAPEAASLTGDPRLALENMLSDTTKTELEVASFADHCLKQVINGPCKPVDSFLGFNTDQSIYWVAWNVRAGYPFVESDLGVTPPGLPQKSRMSQVRLFVFWVGMDGKRHSVKLNTVVTAKDMAFYY